VGLKVQCNGLRYSGGCARGVLEGDGVRNGVSVGSPLKEVKGCVANCGVCAAGVPVSFNVCRWVVGWVYEDVLDERCICRCDGGCALVG